jgi:SAM-dependent methyltransferase
MTDPVLQAQIEAANAYEQLFVPALFQEWVPRVLEAARVGPGHRVLDVACGTGVLARGAASDVGTRGRVAGLDANPGMLAVAERLAPEIEWRHGTAESLPYDDGSFDAVVSQFGLMFFADRERSLREMLRVVTPGGRLAVAVWDSLENTPAYAAEIAVIEKLAGRKATDALRAPFALGDRKDLAKPFADAEIDSIEIASHNGKGVFPSVRSMVEADLRGWLPVMGVVLTEEQIDRVLGGAERALSPYVTAEGKVAFDSPAHIVSAIKP